MQLEVSSRRVKRDNDQHVWGNWEYFTVEGTFELGLGGEEWEEDILVEPGQDHEIPDLVSSSICPVRLILNLKGEKLNSLSLVSPSSYSPTSG